MGQPPDIEFMQALSSPAAEGDEPTAGGGGGGGGRDGDVDGDGDGDGGGAPRLGDVAAGEVAYVVRNVPSCVYPVSRTSLYHA